MDKKRTLRLALISVSVLFLLSTILIASASISYASALPTATNFGICDDVKACSDTTVRIPVNITNLENGPVLAIIFNILYNTSVMRVVEVHNGALTANWESPAYRNFDWGTRVVLVYNHNLGNGTIPDGASGSVALLVFNVSGESGSQGMLNLNFSDIQLAEGPPDYQIGTAPAKNSTFTVVSCSLRGRVTDVLDTGIEGATVTLRSLEGALIASTTTDAQGNYQFTDVATGTGTYNLSVTKRRFWSNHTNVYINFNSGAGVITRADIKLLMVGDLNDNGVAADIGDVAKMWNAWAGLIPKDFHYDLNHNGVAADIGDVAKIWNAWKGEIVLE